MMTGKCSKKLCAAGLGISLGIVSGLFMMLLAWAAHFWGFGVTIVDQWETVFPGYAATVTGGIIGFFWGLLEGFVTGVLIGFFYNLICCCCCCKNCRSCDVDKTVEITDQVSNANKNR